MRNSSRNINKSQNTWHQTPTKESYGVKVINSTKINCVPVICHKWAGSWRFRSYGLCPQDAHSVVEETAQGITVCETHWNGTKQALQRYSPVCSNCRHSQSGAYSPNLISSLPPSASWALATQNPSLSMTFHQSMHLPGLLSLLQLLSLPPSSLPSSLSPIM